MDRIDSHTPYDDESVERAYQVTMACGYHSAEELFNRISEQLNSLPGGLVPTSTKEIAGRLGLNDIDELQEPEEYSFCMDLPSESYDYRVYINSYQDGEGGDYVYLVEVYKYDYFGCIGHASNAHLFDPDTWHKGLIKNS